MLVWDSCYYIGLVNSNSDVVELDPKSIPGELNEGTGRLSKSATGI